MTLKKYSHNGESFINFLWINDTEIIDSDNYAVISYIKFRKFFAVKLTYLN